jgi:hypothetical protein
MADYIQVTAPQGTTVYAVLYDPATNTYFRPSTGTWVAFVSQTAHAVAGTWVRASRFLVTLSGLGADRLDIDARIYARAGGVGAEATTDTELSRAAFDWRVGNSYPVGSYDAARAVERAGRPYLAKIGLEQDTSPLASIAIVSEGSLTFVVGGDSVGMILTSPDTDLSYRITAYNDGAGTLAAEPIGHSVSLFTAVVDVYWWFVSRPVALPGTAPPGYGGSTQVRIGGGRLSPVASGLDGQIRSFVSDVLPLRFDLVGQDSQAISNVGATLTGTLTNAAGAVQASAVAISTAGLNVAEGELLATVTLPATAGMYQLTITRTASATDVQTFGPFAIKAGRK